MKHYATILALPLIAALATAAAPPSASKESQVLAERRLRACLEANASARHAALDVALAAARAACKPQIDDLQDVRVIHETAGMDPDAAKVAERRIARKLGHEVALTVANLTGLPAPHAHH